jgi:molybdopterin converting factor small subunit
MKIKICFHSYFRDLAGTSGWEEELPEGSTLQVLLERVWKKVPALEPMKGSTLVAVGVDYQPREYMLQEGEEVSLFPPVQGG